MQTYKNQMLTNNKDNYKIVCFATNGDRIARNYLDQRFIDDPCRPVDQLLRWHFRQAVFANMRGAGEPIFECDFPTGSDMMGEITSGPYAAEMMEFELFSRLRQEGWFNMYMFREKSPGVHIAIVLHPYLNPWFLCTVQPCGEPPATMLRRGRLHIILHICKEARRNCMDMNIKRETN